MSEISPEVTQRPTTSVIYTSSRHGQIDIRNEVIEAVGLLLRAAFYVATFASITWALLHHSEVRGQSTIQCKDRLNTSPGFEGDPDFYGLGIRLGVYLQWLSDLITAGYLENDRKYVLTTYHIFSISLTVALFVKIFTASCKFSVEVYIVLILFWDGLNIVQLHMMRAISMAKQFRNTDREVQHTYPTPPRPSKKLLWSTQL